jgi:N-acetylmuramoyl-L-alanine amidase
MLRNFSKRAVTFLPVFLLALSIAGLYDADLHAQKKNFVLVLDAGHGGRDPGAVGRISHEKDITLSVVKKMGALVEKNMPDVKVVYTRKTDVFVGLKERANIVNTHHADLFISVHTNAAKNRSAFGAETYTLGLAKTQANLEVAMAENSVMMLEEDYQTRYQGFDPSSVDSYIMFEFMMDTYLDNSIHFASEVQKELTSTSKRHDRGVRQAGFWVLHASASPSVLVELGFISNQSEELYMASERGQTEMARALYNAFIRYKRNYDRKSGNVAVVYPAEETPSAVAVANPPEVSAQSTTSTADKHDVIVPVFKVQFLSSPSAINTSSSRLKGLKGVEYYVEAGLYKYTVGNETNYQKVNQLRNEVRKSFPDAFVVAFLGDQKITIQQALELIN